MLDAEMRVVVIMVVFGFDWFSSRCFISTCVYMIAYIHIKVKYYTPKNTK